MTNIQEAENNTAIRIAVIQTTWPTLRNKKKAGKMRKSEGGDQEEKRKWLKGRVSKARREKD